MEILKNVKFVFNSCKKYIFLCNLVEKLKYLKFAVDHLIDLSFNVMVDPVIISKLSEASTVVNIIRRAEDKFWARLEIVHTEHLNGIYEVFLDDLIQRILTTCHLINAVLLLPLNKLSMYHVLIYIYSNII